MENMIKILSFQSLWCWDFQWICLILLKFYFYFYLFSKTAHVFFCPRVYSLSVPAWQTSDKTHTITKLATTNHLTFLWIFLCKQSVNVLAPRVNSKHGSTCGVDLLLLEHWLVSVPNPLALEGGEPVSASIMRLLNIFVRGLCWHFQMCCWCW